MIGTILALLVLGLVVGALARLLVPGRDSMSLGATILLGIVGTIIGGLVGRALFHSDGPGFVSGLITSIVLLLVLRATTRRRGTI